MHTKEDPVTELFAERGLRCTKQRAAIYEALVSTKAHPTADELFQMVGSELPGMSLATVYNTLEALCEAGLAQKLAGTGSNGSARYDATVDNHLHMCCTRTGSVADVPDELSEQILQHLPADKLHEIEEKFGFKIEQVQIELIGRYDESRHDD